MGQDKTELVHLLNFVKQIYANPDNKEFIAGIQAMVIDGDLDIKQDINDIRVALQLRGKNSLSYSFVKDDSVRNQLLIDNLRMENVALNLTLNDAERFNSFCINAFLQVENILNYYYITAFDDFDDVLDEIENATSTNKYPFKRNSNTRTVGDIPVASKIAAFCSRYFPYDPAAKLYDNTGLNLQKLRMIRNDNFHRGGIGETIPAEDKPSPYGTEKDYKETLIRLVEKIEDILSL